MDSNKATPANPPEWFRLELYDFMGKLDAYGWAVELSYRRRMEAALDYLNRYSECDTAQRYYQLFLCTGSYNPEYRKRSREEFQTVNEGAFPGPGRHITCAHMLEDNFRKNPPIKEIERANSEESEDSWAKKVANQMRPASRRLLVVDLNAPDGVIYDFLSAWLSNVRKQHPVRLKRKGHKHALNLKFTKHHFATWTTKRILPVFDLEFWASLHGIHLSSPKLAEWIFPDQLDRASNASQLIIDSLQIVDVCPFSITNPVATNGTADPLTPPSGRRRPPVPLPGPGDAP